METVINTNKHMSISRVTVQLKGSLKCSVAQYFTPQVIACDILMRGPYAKVKKKFCLVVD